MNIACRREAESSVKMTRINSILIIIINGVISNRDQQKGHTSRIFLPRISQLTSSPRKLNQHVYNTEAYWVHRKKEIIDSDVQIEHIKFPWLIQTGDILCQSPVQSFYILYNPWKIAQPYKNSRDRWYWHDWTISTRLDSADTSTLLQRLTLLLNRARNWACFLNK